jgi:TatD DNase family protein
MRELVVAERLIDSHCHLDLPAFDADRREVISRAWDAGVAHIVIPGIDLAQCRGALALAEDVSHLSVAVGIHPNEAGQYDAATTEALRLLASHPKVVAIGEIGLDYHWDRVPQAQQRLAFEAQLSLAAELGLPVIIHSRNANADVAAVLRQWVYSAGFRTSPLAARPLAGVLHAFSGDQALAEEAYTWNFALGLGGPLTFKNSHGLRALVPGLRLDRLMLETDAPYLAPHPFRGQRNEPAHIRLVCEQLASQLGMTTAAIAAATTAVALRFFQLEDLFGADVPERSKSVHA